eukprot:TRINITY_DN65831_c8_g1_i1.p1 TRINITY_DN65831_c8_g1~~TRINITY_DN65831_c8_g1_i1.p1  ORF type:complete len:261 (+),score=36.43 TRINITY_DN65831_c8_g1_i1:12-794(+)
MAGVNPAMMEWASMHMMQQYQQLAQLQQYEQQRQQIQQLQAQGTAATIPVTAEHPSTANVCGTHPTPTSTSSSSPHQTESTSSTTTTNTPQTVMPAAPPTSTTAPVNVVPTVIPAAIVPTTAVAPASYPAQAQSHATHDTTQPKRKRSPSPPPAEEEEEEEEPETFSCNNCTGPDTDEMVQCDECNRWYHYDCDSTFDPDAPEDKGWLCTNCMYKKDPFAVNEPDDSSFGKKRRRKNKMAYRPILGGTRDYYNAAFAGWR